MKGPMADPEGAAHPPPGAVSLLSRPPLSSPWALRGAFAFALLLFSASVFNNGFQVGDEGVALVDAWRISMGQVPHRDFFEIVPPGSFLPTALCFRLLGPSVAVARGLTALYALLLGWACDAVACRLGATALPRAAVLSFLVPFGVWCWPMPSHHWVATLLQLVAVSCLMRGVSDGRSALFWGGVAGAATGYACATLQDQGAYFALLLLGGALLWARRVPRGRPLFWGWLGGMTAVGTAFAIYLLRAVSFPELWEQLVAFPASRYGVFINQGDFWMGWKSVLSFGRDGGFSQFPLYGWTLVALYSGLTLAPFAAVLCLVAGFCRKWTGGVEIFFLAVGVAAALGCTLHRWSPQNLLWAVPLLLPPVALAFDRGLRSPQSLLRSLLRFSLLGFIGTWILHAAIFARLTEPGRCWSAAGPAGVLRSFHRAEVSSLQSVLQAIERFVPPGAPLFCERYSPLINFMSLRPNPTRFTIFLYPEYNTPHQAEEVVRSLRAHPEARVLLVGPPRRDDAFRRVVLAEFQEVWSSRDAALYARRSPPREGSPP